MEIDQNTINDILFILDNQKQMYEMTLKSGEANFLQKKSIKMLIKNIDNIKKKLE